MNKEHCEKLIERYKIMDSVRDLSLTREEKHELIANIPKRQKERWERMKRMHSYSHVPMDTRHFFMKREIKLMREQRARLEMLKKLI